MGGATSAPSVGAARRATSCGIRTSVRSARCGPCCSTAPTGTMTVWCDFRKASTSGLVISPRNAVSGFISPSSSHCACALWCDASANEPVHVLGPEATRLVVGAAHRDLGEHILVAERVPVGIDVEHDAVDLEQRDHFLHALGNHQRVGLARRLVDISALLRHPVVLEITPAALQHVAMHGI